MKSSIARLRAAYVEYTSAKQERYDELASWDPYAADALDRHKEVAARIQLEESSPIRTEDEPFYISIQSYIHGDELFLCHYHNDGILSPDGETRWDEKIFDLA